MEVKVIIVKLLFFGATVDAANGREIEIALKENLTAAEILELVTTEHPNLKKHNLLFAVNEQYVPLITVLKDGDELAIFTQMSGG